MQEQKEEAKKEARGTGGTNEGDLERTNWLLVYGTVPSNGVKLDT